MIIEVSDERLDGGQKYKQEREERRSSTKCEGCRREHERARGMKKVVIEHDLSSM